MQVGLLGDGPAIDAVAAQLACRDAIDAVDDAPAIADCDLVVLADEISSDRFATVNGRAVDGATSLITIERGGLGGQPVDGVEVGVSTFDPNGPCYECLELRLASTGADGPAIDPPRSVGRIAGAHAGALVVAEDDREPGTRVLTFPYRDRRLLPVPGCPTCGPDRADRWAAPPDAGDARSLEAAIAAGEHGIDPDLGPITEIGEVHSMPLPYYLATLADTSTFGDATAPRHAAGVTEDWNAAYMKGVGEALERYAAAQYVSEDVRYAPPSAISHGVSPADCVRPADRSAITEEIGWVPGAALQSGADRWLPADLVLFPPPDAPVRPAITTGLALGNAGSEAAIGGLLEVIERDATMLAWYSTFEPVAVAVDDPTFDQLRRRARTEDLDVTVLLVTQDVDVPVMAAFVTRDGAFPRFAAGSAAAFDPTAAARDALREAIQNWMELADMGESDAMADSPRIAAHAADPPTAERFRDPSVSVSVDELAGATSSLDALVSAATAADMDPTIAWLTTRDLAELGFVAARVVVPSAQPLLLGTTYFGERAERVPSAMGFRPRPDRGPHPFP